MDGSQLHTQCTMQRIPSAVGANHRAGRHRGLELGRLQLYGTNAD